MERDITSLRGEKFGFNSSSCREMGSVCFVQVPTTVAKNLLVPRYIDLEAPAQ